MRHFSKWGPVIACLALCAVYVTCGSDGADDNRCKEDETRCQGHTVQTCHDGEWGDTLDCEATGQVCGVVGDEALCVIVSECSAGESRCQGEVVQVCSNGLWVDESDCQSTGERCEVQGDTAQCIDDSGCTPGETRCSGDLVQTCVDGTWTDSQDCSATQESCQDGQCVGDPPDCTGLRVYDWTDLTDGVIEGGYFADHHWGTNIEHDPGSLSVVSDGALLREPGTKSLRFYIDPQDPWPPSEPTSHEGNFRAEIYESYEFHTGDTVSWAPDKPLRTEEWIGWSYYFPADFIAGETASTKFLQCHVGTGAAPIDLRLWNPTEYPNYPEGRCAGETCDEFVLHRFFPDDGMDAEVAITDVKPEAGQWYDFVLHVVWDTESSGTGLTEFWINGVQYYSSAGGNTFENPENKDHPYGAMVKLGMYHGSWRDSDAIQASLAEGVDHLEIFMGPVRILSRLEGDHLGADGYECVAPKGPRP